MRPLETIPIDTFAVVTRESLAQEPVVQHTVMARTGATPADLFTAAWNLARARPGTNPQIVMLQADGNVRVWTTAVIKDYAVVPLADFVRTPARNQTVEKLVSGVSRDLLEALCFASLIGRGIDPASALVEAQKAADFYFNTRRG